MRAAITIGAVVIGLLVVLSFALRTGPQPEVEPEETPTEAVEREQPEPDPAPDPDREPADPDEPVEPAAPVVEDEPGVEPEPDPADVAAFDELTVLPREQTGPMTLGEAHPGSPYAMEVRLTPWGAGVDWIGLSEYQQTIEDDEPYTLLQRVQPPIPGARPDDELTHFNLIPYAARELTINGEPVDLYRVDWEAEGVETLDDGMRATYGVTIATGDEQPVAEVLRQYTLREGAHSVELTQQIVNLSDQPLQVAWRQNLQGDVPDDPAAYMGDMRLFVTGYFNLDYNPARTRIFADSGFLRRHTVIDDENLWPSDRVIDAAIADLAWLASENRYFAVITHPAIGPDVQYTPQVPPLEGLFPTVEMQVRPADPGVDAMERGIMLSGEVPVRELEPGASTRIDLGIFAGPRKTELLREHPYDLMHLDQIVRYEMLGPCTFCTFQWLARLLLGFLTFFAGVFADWGIAIIILVLVVRLLLHPITKKAQINMMKMGKQMQAIQPDIEKLKKKYKDNQQQLNQEMMKLYREKGINPANMLGCLPMFLQMPIWIALYAMLYFAVELRHQPAFYGVFPAIGELLGFRWEFLGDLSSADHFIRVFAEPATINLWLIELNFQYINLLPLLMIVVFFFQQKLTMPPPANEQVAQQQRMMRIMILIFPILLFSAPSGLTLYILASTFGGIVDSWIVRRHVNRLEEEGKLFEPRKYKEGGFMDRMMKKMEEKQKEIQAMQEGGGQGGGKGKAAGGGKGTAGKGGKGKGKRGKR